MKKLFLSAAALFFCLSLSAAEKPFRFGDLYLGMETEKIADVLKDCAYINRGPSYVVGDYHDAAVMMNGIGTITDITIKKDTAEPEKLLRDEVKKYSAIYGKPVASDAGKMFFEFAKDGKIMVLRCRPGATGYLYFMVFSVNRETVSYKKMIED